MSEARLERILADLCSFFTAYTLETNGRMELFLPRVAFLKAQRLLGFGSTPSFDPMTFSHACWEVRISVEPESLKKELFGQKPVQQQKREGN